jgi:hypothetical protein
MTIAWEFICGIIVGYLISSIFESIFHRSIYHASASARRGWKHVPLLGEWMQRSWYSHHVIHHVRTFQVNHTQMFRSELEHVRLDRLLKSRGMDLIIDERYGTTVSGGWGIVRFIAPSLPMFLVLWWCASLPLIAGSVVPLALWPAMSKIVHPFLHMRYDDACETCPRWFRLFIRGPCFRFLARHHWLHHRHTNCNYNLLVLGDILIGRFRRPSSDDLTLMFSDGMPLEISQLPVDKPAQAPRK